jgi:hypothetical protein
MSADGVWSCVMCGGVHRIGESHVQAMARAKPVVVKQTPQWRPGDKR